MSSAAVATVVRGSVALLTLALVATAAAADDSKIIFPSGAQQATSPGAASGSTVNTITLILAVVLAAVGGWMMWRNRRAGGASRDSRALAVEETRSLGNRQYLVVASYEGEKFLLGVCPGRIDMLSPLNKRGSSQESSK